jgi:hypothetical protein
MVFLQQLALMGVILAQSGGGREWAVIQVLKVLYLQWS